MFQEMRLSSGNYCKKGEYRLKVKKKCCIYLKKNSEKEILEIVRHGDDDDE